MCVNYERQMQKLQEENQKFQNLASNLQVALDQEKVLNYMTTADYAGVNICHLFFIKGCHISFSEILKVTQMGFNKIN